MISIGKSKFNYNLENKLSSLQSKDIKVNYYYDALGRRVAKKIQHKEHKKGKSFTQTYLYLVDQDKILLGRNGKGEITQYVDGQGIDEHLGEVTKEKAKSYITDHLGSVLNTEASDGRKMFSAFGENLKHHHDKEEFEIEKNSSPVIYGFAGRQLDPESELYYNRARAYNAEMGRFMSKDPIGFAGGDVNIYRYVGNNPINYVDPSGKIAVADDAAAVVIGILAVGAITGVANGYVTYQNTHSAEASLNALGTGFVSGGLSAGAAILTSGYSTFAAVGAAAGIDIGISLLTAPTSLPQGSGKDFSNGFNTIKNPKMTCP